VNDYLDAYNGLRAAMLDDAATLLAFTAYWLDPVQATAPDGDWLYREQMDDPDWAARDIARANWPEFYADINALSWNGIPEIDTFIVNWINDHIPGQIDDIEQVLYYQTPEFYGWDPEDFEYDRDNHRQLFLIKLLGVEGQHVAEHEMVERLADGYATSAPELSWLVRWLFKQSGNTLFDMSYGEACEGITDWPGFRPEDIEAIWETQREAEEYFNLAMVGLDWLEEDDDVFVSFCDSYVIAQCLGVQEEFYDRRRIQCEFDWPQNGNRDDQSQADSGTVVLQLRDREAA
jgi:hypothetical protein